jgi:hypothetical protein
MCRRDGTPSQARIDQAIALMKPCGKRAAYGEAK